MGLSLLCATVKKRYIQCMEISVVIPFYESDNSKEDELNRCLSSLEGQYNDLVIVRQEKNKPLGFARAVNVGYALAKGDFIIMCSDDIILTDGKLRMLCDKETVTSPHVNGMPYQDFWGMMWCTPRWVYEKTGPIDEAYVNGIYYEDNDYYNTIRKIVKPYCNMHVHIDHPHGGRTLELTPDREEKMEVNRRYYIDKWGEDTSVSNINTSLRYGLYG